MAIAAWVCKQLFPSFRDAPEEADSYDITYIADKEGGPAILVTGDSNLLACGGIKVAVAKSWLKEIYRFIVLTNYAQRAFDYSYTNNLMKVYQ